jgi:hypothetical protein
LTHHRRQPEPGQGTWDRCRRRRAGVHRLRQRQPVRLRPWAGTDIITPAARPQPVDSAVYYCYPLPGPGENQPRVREVVGLDLTQPSAA